MIQFCSYHVRRISFIWSSNALPLRLCRNLWWCHSLATCGNPMGFPFQPKWHCVVWRVWWIILQYNATLCVTLCYPHHLLGKLLFTLPRQFTSAKSLKRYFFGRVFGWISFAFRFYALRHSANILNHITECLTNLVYTIDKLRIRCVSQCFRPHVATQGIFHFNQIEHIM